MEKIHSISIAVSDEIGSVSGLLTLPADSSALMVLSHGAGAGMEHAFMTMLAHELALQGVGTLRFNFAYMEKGSGPPDRPKKAHQVIAAAMTKGKQYSDGRPLLAGGKSFGGRMMSQMAASGTLSEVAGIVYYGFPLHAPGRPGTQRAAHLADITVPQLFLQGTRDTLASMELMREVCDPLSGATLMPIEGGDHSFKTLKRSGISHEQVIRRLAVETASFAGGL